MTALILAQAQQDSAQAVADSLEAAAASDSGMSVLEILMQGGIVMIPIALLSVFAVYLFIERILTVRKSSQGGRWDRVRSYVEAGDVLRCDRVLRFAGHPNEPDANPRT